MKHCECIHPSRQRPHSITRIVSLDYYFLFVYLPFSSHLQMIDLCGFYSIVKTTTFTDICWSHFVISPGIQGLMQKGQYNYFKTCDFDVCSCKSVVVFSVPRDPDASLTVNDPVFLSIDVSLLQNIFLTCSWNSLYCTA